jgi:hypothetical protein
MQAAAFVAIAMLVAPGATAGPRTRLKPKPAPPTWTKEPDAYRGIPWGTSLQAAKEQADIHTCHCEDETWHPIDCPETGSSPVRVCHGGLVAGDIWLQERWSFTNDRFGGVDFGFESAIYEKLRDIFIERYGPPTDTLDGVFQNRMGAKVSNPTLVWDGKTVAITLSRFADTLDKGHGAVMTRAMVQQHAAAEERARKESAKIF